MMKHKRLTLLAGHYGSGKTNIAVNMALTLAKTEQRVVIADLDIVNPYFRTKDSSKELADAGIQLICSPYANTNLDIPAIPQEMYAITDDKTITAVIDIGGDDRGAYALGRYAPAIREENDFDFWFVANCYRPLTANVPDALGVMREIEQAAGLPFTGVINNSNLGALTSPADVLASLPFAEELSKQANLPLVMTSVMESLYDKLADKIPDLFAMQLQTRIFDS